MRSASPLSPPTPRRHRQERWLLIALAMTMGWFYFWCARQPDAGFLAREPSGYYGLQTEGFRQGHLSVALEPHPGLLALPNPYDPVANAPFRVHDMSLYHGKYYLYFGVVPILTLFWPYAALTGGYLTEPFAVGLFCVIGFCAGLALLVRFRGRYCPNVSSGWMIGVGAAWGLGNYVVILLQRPFFYQIPIACAFMYLMLALLAIDAALHALTLGRTAGWLGCASLCLGLCLGCRPNYLPAALALAVVCGWTIWRWRRGSGGWARRSAGLAAAAFGPIGLIGTGLLAYNYARFGSPSEFGMHYQLAGERIDTLVLLSPRYILRNVSYYLFNAGRWSPYFPFLEPDPAAVLGGLRYFWIGWLGIFVFLPLGAPGDSVRRVLGATLAVAGAALLLMLSAFFGTTERYLPDFMPCLILLGSSGLLVLLERTSRWRRRRWPRTALAGLIFVTAGSGLLLVASRTPARSRQLAAVEEAFNGFSYAWMKLSGGMPGTLALDVEFVRASPGREDPLVESGMALGMRDVLSVVHLDGDQVQFRLFHAGSGGLVGAPVPVEYGRRYRVEVLYGGLLPPERHPYFKGWSPLEILAARRTVRVRLDGRDVLQAAMESYPSRPGDIHIGWSDYAGGALLPRFRGSLSVVKTSRLSREDFAWPDPPASKAVKMSLLFPLDRTGRADPLLLNGALRDCDLVYVRYIAPGRLRFGFDRYGSGGPLTKEVAYDPLTPQELVVWVGGWERSGNPGRHGEAAGQRLLIAFNGEVLLDKENSAPRREASRTLFGRNPCGATTAETEFTGRLLAMTALDPADIPTAPVAKAEGAAAITLRFPAHRLGAAEPILTTGRTEAGDFIYVRYVDLHHVVFGFDHWGVGGAASAPVPVDYDREYRMEVTLGALYPEEDFVSGRRPAELKDLVRVKLDGQTVLETRSLSYPSSASQRQVGTNLIGGSTSGTNFTGEIVDVQWEKSR